MSKPSSQNRFFFSLSSFSSCSLGISGQSSDAVDNTNTGHFQLQIPRAECASLQVASEKSAGEMDITRSPCAAIINQRR